MQNLTHMRATVDRRRPPRKTFYYMVDEIQKQKKMVLNKQKKNKNTAINIIFLSDLNTNNANYMCIHLFYVLSVM